MFSPEPLTEIFCFRVGESENSSGSIEKSEFTEYESDLIKSDKAYFLIPFAK